MWGLMVAGLLFFPGIFLLSSRSLRILMGWSQADAVIVSARSVSSVQAVMAVAAGCVIASACRSDLLHDRHWLTDTYITFAAPYFVYDVYAMFLCDWHRRRVKGHEADGGARQAAILGYVRREYLMVLHHIFMVVFCLPASLVWRQGKGDYFQGVLFLAELSTPFVCLAKVLIQVRVHPRPSGGPGGPVAMHPGGGASLAPADLLVLVDVPAGVAHPRSK
ncbi:ceramide synthase-like isoform X2 [Syngnathus scovelli]|uniref:ceramide synthase-like isoform X2 n=1 Tax=Syngnathus scovelli TaxID=161590 RepID=UPI00211092A4|nr:ceramide synthase-like isoform X2 [Syngnathus scovelli]